MRATTIKNYHTTWYNGALMALARELERRMPFGSRTQAASDLLVQQLIGREPHEQARAIAQLVGALAATGPQNMLRDMVIDAVKEDRTDDDIH